MNSRAICSESSNDAASGAGNFITVCPQTARTHVQNILTKLGVHSRLEAAAFVTQNNVLEELGTRA